TTTGDPYHSCTSGVDGKTVWYRFTASYTGRLRVNTLGSSYDTALTAYSNNNAIAANEVACNDDMPDGTRQSQIEFSVTSGATYLIEASAWGDYDQVSGTGSHGE